MTYTDRNKPLYYNNEVGLGACSKYERGNIHQTTLTICRRHIESYSFLDSELQNAFPLYIYTMNRNIQLNMNVYSQKKIAQRFVISYTYMQ